MDKKRALPVLNQPAEAPADPGLARRRVLQGLFVGAGAGLTLPGVAEGHPMQAHAHTAAPAAAQAKAKAADWKPEFLDAHQFATLTALCARIVPGSDKAQADRFVDALLAVESNERQKRFLTAMGALEGESLRRFAKPFKSASPAQQDEVLTAASTQEPGRKDWVWTPGTPLERPAWGADVVTLRDHFDH